jgi:hypothetical protein
MIGDDLHEYDLQLCDYALSAIREHMDVPAFSEWMRDQLSPPALLQFLVDGSDPAVEQEPMLLSDPEFYQITLALDGIPRNLDRPWLAYDELHARYVQTLTDVRDGLTKQVAEDWSTACVQFAASLERPAVRLSEGIEIVQDWTRHLRKLLSAMRRIDLLPQPEGQQPTPSHPNSIQASQRTGAVDVVGAPSGRRIDLPLVLDRLAAALEKHTVSAGPMPEALSKEDAARFIGVETATIEYLIRTRLIAYVQCGSQRGRVIPIESLRNFLRDHRQATAEELLKKRRR